MQTSLESLGSCLVCGHLLLEASVPEARVIEGVEFQVTFSGKKCGHCGRSYFEGADMYDFESAIAERVAMSTASSAEAIDMMLLATRLDETELCQLLHVDRDTLRDCREGKRRIDPCARALLALLLLERSEGSKTALDRLRRLANPVALEGCTIQLPRAP